MEPLTHNEEQLMQVFWSLEKGFVRDILNELPEPKPPYTTLASNIKQLEKKGYLDHKTYGNIHEYFPIISQEQYRSKSFNSLLKNYFDGSIKNVLSFMVKEKGVSEKEIEELKKLIEENENKDMP
ncbi:Transcriptional regulator, MecI family [Indibacter alkaliphilus LW1]|jgi:BlaI family penicillinase repressor|uniref:Transcriptional regulator, MecI family n=1 Tax=Indibacter alkaliphilus (strain CCUG 57479 / KCTC 22604 / LW1) TaxID=1189612 RepID=S2DSM4_INDAL|nr:BlaI/MecI/CopY family transcriptional regulator [Indibacter alkaliphilus]EPA00286.1 Transcriptional regulator, MecI family [Indibacter alkaliphilus LW1]